MRFAARGNLFWLVLPLNRPTILPYSVLFWVGMGLAISVAGAYLIIFRLTQQLRKVTEAAQAVGRGEPPAPLEERGPQEIRDLSVGFNEMASDLKKLDSDRRLMLAGISHDLRTPLTHLRIAVELAAANAEPTIAAGMVHDIEDMDSILKQFLDYARDGSEEPFEESDLDAIVQEVSHRYTARGHPVKIELGKIPPFPFRRLAMRRVITNLVDNAVRYGRAGVRVKTRCTKATVTVVVSDEGPGIRSGNPADFLKPFAREDISRSESGAGLGLAIVDRAVRLHGGRLRLENQKPTGLLALIELPLTRTSMNLT
jgi:two-component system osmolarity sensor histidine kinase EnvZ